MGWGVTPVVEFYGIHHPICPQIIRHVGAHPEADDRLVALASIHCGWQIESDQGESGLAVDGIFKSDDMLVALGASLKLEAAVDAKILVIDLHVSMIPAVVAGQPF